MAAALFAQVDALGRSIVEYSNPVMDYDARSTKGWPFIELSAALPVALAYLALVAYGYSLKSQAEAKPAQAKAPKPEGKAPAWSVGGALKKLNSDPIYWGMLIYNITQVVLCSYMMFEAARVAYENYPKAICNVHNTTSSKLAPILWLFYVSKILDFFDTIFIIAKGAWTRFSFLHTYHHFSIFMTYWLVANAAMDGDVYYTVVANSFVHLVMYFYYALQVLGVKVSWDMLVTLLQMFQFVTMNAQAIYILYYQCPYPNRVTSFYLVYIISLFFLFGNFLIRKHFFGPKKDKAAKKA